MTFSENDREVLCLVNAFKEIKSRGKRRALLMLVEELAQNSPPSLNIPRPLRAGGSYKVARGGHLMKEAAN